MNQFISTLWGAATLDQQTFERVRDSKQAMRTGIVVLLIVFLVAGSLQFVFNLADNLQPFTEQEAGQFREQFLQGMETWFQFIPQQNEFAQEFMDQFLRNFDAGLNMGVQIANLPTPLPKGLAAFFETLGRWLSEPLGHLGAWLAYAIWVLLFSRLLGGRGGVDRFLGCTALYAAPNLLAFFRPIPYVGGLLVFVGMIWGWVVYVRGVQVSQRFDTGKAILATLLPILLLIALSIILALIAVIGIVSTGS